MKCPKCGSDHVITTCMGCMGLDYNRVRCYDCQEVGVAWHWQSDDEINEYLESQINRGVLRSPMHLLEIGNLRLSKATGGDLSHDLP